MAMKRIARHISPAVTPQSEPIPGSNQVVNSAGGYVWQADLWSRLDRFLILGTDGGTYYIDERKLTKQNAEVVNVALSTDSTRTIARIVEVSDRGLAPKNNAAILALAIAITRREPAIRTAARAAIPKVCRIGTHLFQLAEAIEALSPLGPKEHATGLHVPPAVGKWGRGLRTAIARWYTAPPVARVAYQAVKYQQREGWDNRALLRLAHPKTTEPARAALFDWIVRGDESKLLGEVPDIVAGFIAAKKAETSKDLARMIRDYKLPREAVPSQFLDEIPVWEALLDEPMGLTAMIRNLATMTRIGLIKPLGGRTKEIIARITSRDELKKARIHPMALLIALKTYAAGHGLRGKHRWEPVQPICDALDSAFYLAFENAPQTGLNHLLAVDVSGSMTQNTISNIEGLSAREAAAAMALVTAAREPNHVITGFFNRSKAGKSYSGGHMFFGNSNDWRDGIAPLALTPKMRIEQAVALTSNLPFGGTDCSLPMRYALENKLDVDVFVVYTDSETWAGEIHAAQMLKKYRQERGRNAKLIVVAMVANEFTIADPNDPGMLDVVGFDASVPAVMAAFAAGGKA